MNVWYQRNEIKKHIKKEEEKNGKQRGREVKKVNRWYMKDREDRGCNETRVTENNERSGGSTFVFLNGWE